MVDPEGFKDETSVFRKRIVAGSLLETRRTQSYPTRQTRSGDSDDDIEVIETKLDEVSLVDPSSLTNTELMTFPSRIAGYSLVTKDAGFFLVDCFHPVKWETSWTKHILSTSPNMQSILRIASGFAHLSQQFDYGIEAKGRGLVILLYGPSGCGKTLTAGKSTIGISRIGEWILKFLQNVWPKGCTYPSIESAVAIWGPTRTRRRTS